MVIKLVTQGHLEISGTERVDVVQLQFAKELFQPTLQDGRFNMKALMKQEVLLHPRSK